MFDVVSAVITIISIAASIIGVFLGILILKKPHITFTLDKSKISLYNEEKEEETVSLLWASIANKKKRYLGDTAKNITACVLYRAPANDNSVEPNFSNGLPWLETFTSRTKIPQKLSSYEDVLGALEQHFFIRKETNLPQGRATGLAVAYGIKSINKIFLATKPPVEIPLPHPDKPHVAFTGCFLRLEVAGENLVSTQSEGTFIMARDWENWTVPSKVETIRSSNMLETALLRIGMSRKQKVVAVKSPKEN
jgi:hypothetical protein